jgi:putative hemolysin
VGATIKILFLILVITLFVSGCSLNNKELNKNMETPQIANPASVHCIENSGTLEIRTSEDGSQYGVCVFSNGSECEEWAFLKGECSPGVKK